MKLLSMSQIPLSAAYLCLDCNCVSNCSFQCPACASSVLMGLEPVLNRKQEKQSRARTGAADFPAWRSPLHLEKAQTQLRSVA